MNSNWTEHPDPPKRRAGSWRWIVSSLQLAVLRKPASPLEPGTAWRFAGVGVLWLLAGLLLDDWLIETPREFSEWALTERSFPLLLALAGSALFCALLQRGRAALGLASVLLLALLPASLLWIWTQARLSVSGWLLWLPALYLALLAIQLARWTGTGVGFSARHWSAAASAAVLLIVSWQWVPDSPWWWPLDESSSEEALEVTTEASDLGGFSAEQLWAAQPDQLQRALDRLAPQRPGQIDLYVIALAGDGGEAVFRNEVGFVRQLAEQRLDAAERVLPLVNHPSTLDSTPIASVSNLRAALSGVAGIMDPEEDLLWLFLTSHGSEDHELYLGLDPLPLDWLDPDTLRGMLDEAGLGWRVIVVSACYSGGFVEALRDERSLVITAARADRPSFGCGVQSDITWFGEAFLAEALNTTTDFGEAFRQAKARVREREREEGERPSHPQIALGQAIAPRLARWQQGLQKQPPVHFSAGLPLSATEATVE